MERLSKFRRSKKDSAGATGVVSAERDRSTSRTPSPGAQVLVPPPERRRERHSPFRSLHFRSSAKRARSSPPASLPQSPTTAVHHHEFGELAAGGSPLSVVQHASPPSTRSSQQLRIPSFLTLSPKEIELKFQELVWLERDRLALASHNMSPSFKWATVPPKHRVRQLDRYMNIQPWHNNRIKLRVPKGQLDYINASPITLSTTLSSSGSSESRGVGEEEHPSRYIAMQGPKQNSIEHVWRMVVEQLRSPAVIVMLTETNEGAIEKCAQYFPSSPEAPPFEIGIHDEFRDGFRASVRCESIEPTCAGDAIELRKLVIRVYRRAHPPLSQGQQQQQPEQPEQSVVNGSGNVVRMSAMVDEGSDDDEMTGEEEDDDDNEDMMVMSPIKSDPTEGSHLSSLLPPLSTQLNSKPRGSKQNQDRGLKRQQDDQEHSTQKSRNVSPTSSEATERAAMEEEVLEERVVYHFLYKKWPDFGVPALEDLDSFFTLMRLSREKNADVENPRIVHCSAGVGRSGTFIALEHLMRELDSGLLENYDAAATSGRRSIASASAPSARSSISANRSNGNSPQRNGTGRKAAAAGGGTAASGTFGSAPWRSVAPGTAAAAATVPAANLPEEVDDEDADNDLIFHTVNQLREQRRTMVQAESQFLFIYQVLRKLWQDRYGVPEEEQEPAAKRLEVDPFVAH